MRMIKCGMLFLMGILIFTGCTSSNREEEAQTKSADVIIGIEEDNAPYYSTDENGTGSGFYVELMDALQQEEEFTYEFLPMSAAEFMTGDISCDIYLGTVEIEAGNLTAYVQSDAICETKLCLVTTKGSGVIDASDLRDVSVAARAGTGEESFARYLASKYDGDFVLFQNLTDVETDVTDGYSQAAVMEIANLSSSRKENSSWKTIIESEKYFSVHCFTAYSDSGIPEKVADGFAAIQADGTLDTLIQKYGLD